MKLVIWKNNLRIQILYKSPDSAKNGAFGKISRWLRAGGAIRLASVLRRTNPPKLLALVTVTILPRDRFLGEGIIGSADRWLAGTSVTILGEPINIIWLAGWFDWTRRNVWDCCGIWYWSDFSKITQDWPVGAKIWAIWEPLYCGPTWLTISFGPVGTKINFGLQSRMYRLYGIG